MKNRFFSALALAAVVSFAACEAEEPATEGEIIGEPAVEEPMVEPAPTTVPVAPLPADTLGAVPTETAPAAIDTNATTTP